MDAYSPAGAEHGVGGLAWWQQAVLYQIYPLSFQDSNGDGVGDLPGIASRLDHLSWLGVGAVWLSPVQPSPMADFGYDVADFTGVDPRFGTLDDLDRLVAELHARGIRLILDFVPNHTSSEHPWFVQSRASRANPKRDWYIWRDPAPDGGPPNNWLSRFGGSAWAFDPGTGQYYYHAFLAEQPDLNWRNPQVRQAMADVLRFWMRRGIDGFRVDAAAVLAVDTRLRDDPPNPEFREGVTPPPERFQRVYTDDRPVTLEYLAGLRQVIEEFPDRVLLGEVDTSGERTADFYGSERRRSPSTPKLPASRHAMGGARDRGHDPGLSGCAALWRLAVLGDRESRQAADRQPARTRTGASGGDAAANLAGHADPLCRGRDRDGRRAGPLRAGARPVRAPRARPRPEPRSGARADALGREPERRLHGRRAVAADRRRRRRLQRRCPAQGRALAGGALPPSDPTPPERACASGGQVLAYCRCLDGRRIVVALNFADADGEVALPGAGQIRLSTQLDRQDKRVDESVRLRAHEGIVLAIEG